MNSYDNIPKISRIFHLIKNVNSAIVYLVKANGIYLKKEVFILRKKSHILLARYLADQMPANVSLQSHRKAFCLGNILPDIQPSFVTKRHEYFGTYNEVRSKITELVSEGAGHWNERVFWRRTGEVMHYIADYFTFPHNRTFDGSLREHNSYEKNLKNELKSFVRSGKADVYAEKNIRFENLSQLLAYIRMRHSEYLNRKRNIDEDIHYILSVCYQVFQGLFQLCVAVAASMPAVSA